MKRRKTVLFRLKTLKKTFNKVDKYPFEVIFGNIDTDNVFISASELNALRRNAYAGYYEKITSVERKTTVNFTKPSQKNDIKNDKIAAICTDFRNLSADIGILKLADFNSDAEALTKNFKGENFCICRRF